MLQVGYGALWPCSNTAAFIRNKKILQALVHCCMQNNIARQSHPTCCTQKRGGGRKGGRNPEASWRILPELGGCRKGHAGSHPSYCSEITGEY